MPTIRIESSNSKTVKVLYTFAVFLMLFIGKTKVLQGNKLNLCYFFGVKNLWEFSLDHQIPLSFTIKVEMRRKQKC